VVCLSVFEEPHTGGLRLLGLYSHRERERERERERDSENK